MRRRIAGRVRRTADDTGPFTVSTGGMRVAVEHAEDTNEYQLVLELLAVDGTIGITLHLTDAEALTTELTNALAFIERHRNGDGV